MSEPITKVGMTPCHPGEFIREEILNELHLPARGHAVTHPTSSFLSGTRRQIQLWSLIPRRP